ncbi:hypothetical protein OEZ85_003304 [Tetradesmus obliquus]|uniref:Acid phosphatase n=1 Tax=Tetradesmus obliquus TaxID=3088 RepID=A0ABY8U2Z7_TETOB|nr:hypothetical protein OEZ85_003304 [Tetradesmus obliquus]
MQASAPLDEDLEGLTGYSSWQQRSRGASPRSTTARLIAEAAGGVCLLSLLCWVIALSMQLRSLQGSSARIAPECVHALGGGPVGSGGSLHPIMDPQAWPWEDWVAAAAAQPLQPMLALYGALCRHGYAIALVTGRHEASRNSTMANLQRAGYGSPCSSSSSSSSSGADAPCCYDALLMRPANDSRLASVYKPWARAQLLAGGGYRLAGLLGDQFSDINGAGVEPGSGVAAYKLPNPFYFIL